MALFIGYAGIDAAKDTISLLVGQAPDPQFVAQVRSLVLSYPNILGVHDLIVHNYGPGRTLISLHAEVPSDGDMLNLHETIDGIEHDLLNRLHCHAVIHMDPVRVGDEETSQVKGWVQDILTNLDPAITQHDFRLVKCTSHTKVVFDISVPYRVKLSDEALIEAISSQLCREHPHYLAKIDVDRV